MMIAGWSQVGFRGDAGDPADRVQSGEARPALAAGNEPGRGARLRPALEGPGRVRSAQRPRTHRSLHTSLPATHQSGTILLITSIAIQLN